MGDPLAASRSNELIASAYQLPILSGLVNLLAWRRRRVEVAIPRAPLSAEERQRLAHLMKEGAG